MSEPDCGGPGGTLRFFLESVAVAEVDARREEIAAAFTAEELAAIAGRRTQTLAGLFALKAALLALHRAKVPGSPRRHADFVLAHLPGGKPYLAAAPPLPGDPPVAVSISHTRGWAYGLAVLQEAPRAEAPPRA